MKTATDLDSEVWASDGKPKSCLNFPLLSSCYVEHQCRTRPKSSFWSQHGLQLWIRNLHRIQGFATDWNRLRVHHLLQNHCRYGLCQHHLQEPADLQVSLGWCCGESNWICASSTLLSGRMWRRNHRYFFSILLWPRNMCCNQPMPVSTPLLSFQPFCSSVLVVSIACLVRLSYSLDASGSALDVRLPTSVGSLSTVFLSVHRFNFSSVLSTVGLLVV